MEAIKRVFKFSIGGALGAAIGAGVAVLTAPKRGEEFRKESLALVEQVKSEGEAAKLAKAAAKTTASGAAKKSDPS